MEYKVVVTSDAEEDLSNFLFYLIFVIRNPQAAHNVNEDYLTTINLLKTVAGTMKIAESFSNDWVIYRKISFRKHRYYMLYRIDDDTVFIDHIFHELQFPDISDD
ncbi:MAG: type II toxin-antitoxin system RelE/ParE family toxin [Lachnospiraceae bacterium]|nr:type II toxin-antitoxin system RelE/ParE family toxin [Lachnospiraceae bacterium]